MTAILWLLSDTVNYGAKSKICNYGNNCFIHRNNYFIHGCRVSAVFLFKWIYSACVIWLKFKNTHTDTKCAWINYKRRWHVRYELLPISSDPSRFGCLIVSQDQSIFAISFRNICSGTARQIWCGLDANNVTYDLLSRKSCFTACSLLFHCVF